MLYLVDGLVGWWVGGLVGGWEGGWVGCDILPPSIFFIFKYINKQDVLIPNMVSKIVYGP